MYKSAWDIVLSNDHFLPLLLLLPPLPRRSDVILRLDSMALGSINTYNLIFIQKNTTM